MLSRHSVAAGQDEAQAVAGEKELTNPLYGKGERGRGGIRTREREREREREMIQFKRRFGLAFSTDEVGIYLRTRVSLGERVRA